MRMCIVSRRELSFSIGHFFSGGENAINAAQKPLEAYFKRESYAVQEYNAQY